MTHFPRVKGLRALPGLVIVGASALALAACNTDKLVSVEDPNQLRPGDLDNAASTPQLVQGAIRQFVGGYSGFGDDAFLSSSATISDEFYYGDTFTTRQAADSRNLQPASLGNISDAAFSRLQQARLNARRGVRAGDAVHRAGHGGGRLLHARHPARDRGVRLRHPQRGLVRLGAVQRRAGLRQPRPERHHGGRRRSARTR